MPLYPSEKFVKVGSKLLPAYEGRDADGKYTGELVVSTAFRQPVSGAKIHGGHCALCGCELTRTTNESARGVCDACAEGDPRWSP